VRRSGVSTSATRFGGIFDLHLSGDIYVTDSFGRDYGPDADFNPEDTKFQSTITLNLGAGFKPLIGGLN
jgi:hypothetical protein